MQAATHPAPTPPAPTPDAGAAPPKLTIEKFADAGIACLRFAGTIDESFEGKRLGETATGDVLVIDLGGVRKISSFGIREWVDFATSAAKRVRSMILVECAPKVVDQLNMVANFAGGGRVFSFYAPFRCDYCDSEHRVVLQVDKDHEAIKSMKLAERPCPSCKEAMYFDDDGATFFSYILGQEKFELEPEVAAFLAARLSYAVSDLSRKLRVDKVIEGRTTYVRLAGDLDASFPREKLAEGLEGTVILDLGAIGRIEPAGAAEWRGFVQMATPLVDALYLASVPPAFLEKLCTRDDLGPRAQVMTFTLPYACATCGTTTQQTIEVEQHYEVLKFATAPELRCTGCKGALQCAAGENAMALLPDLPKPGGTTEIVRSLGILRERALQAQAQGRRSEKRNSITATPVAPQRASLLIPFLAASLAVVLAAGGYLLYQRLSKDDRPTGEKSAAVKPAWADGSPGTATCSTGTDDIACVAASTLVARQDEAEDEAADAALDALANALADKITDKRWRAAVPEIYAALRKNKLAAFTADTASARARADVREGRHATAMALRASSNGIVAKAPTERFWEERSDRDGKRYAAFAKVTLGAADAKKLVEAYARSASSLGATVVDAFPLLGWAYPHVEKGAIVVALDQGQLKEIGVAERSVVLAIDGHDVSDAATFAQFATDELAALTQHGGTLRFKVQTAAPEPREFALAIKAVEPPTQPTQRDTKPPHPNGTGTTPTNPGGSGGVNTWDRFNREDPSK